MNVERLNKLVELLESLEPESFDLRSWVLKYNHVLIDESPQLVEDHIENPCGTVACAIGWACLNPDFNALGLKLDNSPAELGEPTYYCPTDEWQYSGFRAVAKFFDIGYENAEYLFLQQEYGEKVATKDEVIARIKEYILINSGEKHES